MSAPSCDHRSARPVRRAEQRCELCWSVGEDSRVVGPGLACGCGWSAVTQDAGLAHERLTSHHHAAEVRHHVASLRSEVKTAQAELDRIRASLPEVKAELEARARAETREAREKATVAIREARAKIVTVRADLAAERAALRKVRAGTEDALEAATREGDRIAREVADLAARREEAMKPVPPPPPSSTPPTCSECGRTYSRWDALDRHVRSAHGSGRPGDPAGLAPPPSTSLSSGDGYRTVTPFMGVSPPPPPPPPSILGSWTGPAPPPNTAPSPDNVPERAVSPHTPPPPPGRLPGRGEWGAEEVPCPECGKAVRRDSLNRHRARCAARRSAP